MSQQLRRGGTLMRLKSVLIRLSKEKWGCFYLVFHTLMTLSLRHGYTGFLYIFEGISGVPFSLCCKAVFNCPYEREVFLSLSLLLSHILSVSLTYTHKMSCLRILLTPQFSYQVWELIGHFDNYKSSLLFTYFTYYTYFTYEFDCELKRFKMFTVSKN